MKSFIIPSTYTDGLKIKLRKRGKDIQLISYSCCGNVCESLFLDEKIKKEIIQFLTEE